jgi:glyoxylase-like metal-dependent hydrolase (beta-lactamase superfamily II)
LTPGPSSRIDLKVDDNMISYARLSQFRTLWHDRKGWYNRNRFKMKTASSQPVYQLFAVKYAGPVTKSGAHIRWQKDWDKKAGGNYYIWVIRNQQRTVIVDTGCTPETAMQKGLGRYINPARILPAMEIDPKEVESVILTHLHWDHAGGAVFFPHANFLIHEKEYSFWTGDSIASAPPFQALIDRKSLQYLKRAKDNGLVRLVKSNRQLFPGIGAILAPGHSPGLMAVSVNTRKGIAIIGSDSAFIVENYSENWPHDIVFDMADYMRTMKMLKKKASPGLLFAGHDPSMADNYPGVARHITRLA